MKCIDRALGDEGADTLKRQFMTFVMKTVIKTKKNPERAGLYLLRVFFFCFKISFSEANFMSRVLNFIAFF